MDRTFFVLGCVLAGLGVLLGAFGAHALKTRLAPDLLTIYEVGVRYHLVHALALLAVALASGRWPAPRLHTAGWLMVAGIVLFSGSLYVLALSGVRQLGAVTPLGGLAWVGAWGMAAWTVARWRGER